MDWEKGVGCVCVFTGHSKLTAYHARWRSGTHSGRRRAGNLWRLLAILGILEISFLLFCKTHMKFKTFFLGCNVMEQSFESSIIVVVMYLYSMYEPYRCLWDLVSIPFKICQKGSTLPKKAGLRREANLTPPAIWDLSWLLTIGLISDSPLTATNSVKSGNHRQPPPYIQFSHILVPKSKSHQQNGPMKLRVLPSTILIWLA